MGPCHFVNFHNKAKLQQGIGEAGAIADREPRERTPKQQQPCGVWRCGQGLGAVPAQGPGAGPVLGPGRCCFQQALSEFFCFLSFLCFSEYLLSFVFLNFECVHHKKNNTAGCRLQ